MKCRKNVKNLTADEKRRFVNAFVALKSQNSVIHPGAQSRYDDFVETHLNAMMAAVGWAHQDSVFFPWHRELLYQFEALLQSVDPSVMIPYWDWTRDQNSAAPGFPFKHDFLGVDGTDANSDRVERDPAAPAVDATHPYIYPFDPEPWNIAVDDGDGLTFFQRAFGERSDAPSLPMNGSAPTGVSWSYRQAIGAPTYLSLRSRSEDIHNLVHRWVGGNMLRMTSPNDPVFFLHHAAIDRMWSIWQKKVPAGTSLFQESSLAAGHKLNDPLIFNDMDLPPFATGTTNAQTIDGHALHGVGVWYESDIPELTNETGATLAFNSVPEGLTSYKAVRFRIKGCRPVHFRITGAPAGNFGLTPMGSEFVADPVESADFFDGFVWVQLTAVAGAIAPSSVDIHAYIVDEEGYYAAVEGGEFAIGDFHVDLTATTVARESNAVALVLDRSGSMAAPAGGTSTKSDLLRNAIQVFRDLMLPNDEVAVVTFDHLVSAPVPMQQVSTAPAFATVDVSPRGATWIGGGIQQGAAQLAAATHANRSMIVLTDGNENRHPYIGELDPALLTNRTYAIGFGLPGGVSDAALNQITANTHGDLIITGAISTDEQRFNLTKYFVQLLAGISRMDVILDPQGALFLGSKHVIPFQITDDDVYADIIVLCPSPKLLNFELETPDGKIIGPAVAAAEPTIRYIVGQQVTCYRVVLPALAGAPSGSHAGTWKAILSVVGGGRYSKLLRDETVLKAAATSPVGNSLPYSFLAHTYSNLHLAASTLQESPKPGGAITLLASLNEHDAPLRTDAAVWAKIIGPDRGASDLRLQRTGPGTYSASFTTTLPGVYSCRLMTEGLTSGGFRFTREKTFSFGAYYGDYSPVPPPKPDEALCQLIHCFLSENVLSPAFVKEMAKRGINLKQLEKCVSRLCPEPPTEDEPRLVYKTFVAARKKQARAKPAIRLRRAVAAKRLKQAARPVFKPRPKTEVETMFLPLKKEVFKESKPKRPHGKKRSIKKH